MEDTTQSTPPKIEPEPDKQSAPPPPPADDGGGGGGGGGWGGWGLPSFSVLSDLQKAATLAAEEISRNASRLKRMLSHVDDSSKRSMISDLKSLECRSYDRTRDPHYFEKSPSPTKDSYSKGDKVALKPSNHSSLHTSDMAPKLTERWADFYRLPEACEAWRALDITALCGPGVTVRRGSFATEDGELGVTTAMMQHVFPLPITDDMAKFLRYFDVSPEQIPPVVLLVYERAKMLESHFQVKFGYEEIVQLLHITEGAGTHAPRLTARFTEATKGFTGIPGDFPLWYHCVYLVSGRMSTILCARNIVAVEVAKNAAKSLDFDSESPNEQEDKEDSEREEKHDDSDNDDERMRKDTLDKLEKASEDSLLGQGLKVLDTSVENLASGAWQAFGNAWKGGSNLVHKLENSAANMAESIQSGGLTPEAGSLAPSIFETGKAFTSKGMQVLERVGKETMDLLINETGIEIEKNIKIGEQQSDEEQPFEEVTFDRCFYIYGGPEQLEELEALSSHYVLLFNRRKAKLSSEQKSFYDAKLRQIQQIFSLGSEIDGNDSGKGKEIETVEVGGGDEMKILRDSSVSKAADLASGFTTILSGLASTEVIQRTTGRLETIHSEGVHRLSELCCFAVSQLLTLGKSIISNSSKSQNEDEVDVVKIDWPEDSIEKAKVIRSKAQLMAGDVEAVSNSFLTGITDVVEAYHAAIKSANAEISDGTAQAQIPEKAKTISNNLKDDHTTAIDKIQDGLQYLAFLVLSSSLPSA